MAAEPAPTPGRTGIAAAGAGGTTSASRVARVGRGTQALAVQAEGDTETADATATEGNAGTQLPSLATDDSSTAGQDSIAVQGTQGQVNGLAGFSEDDLRNRVQDMQRQGMTNGDIAGAFQGAMQGNGFGGPGGGFGGDGGGFGGPGGGGPGGGGPGGGGPVGGRGGGGGGGFRGGGGGGGFGFRGQNPNAWHGSVGYQGSDSALNADARSFTGTPIIKPQADRNQLVISLTGTPYIPHLMAANPKQFLFFSLTESRNTTPSTAQVIVPTLAQRFGDLTPAFQAQPTYGVPVFDPKYGTAYGKSQTNDPCDPRIGSIGGDLSPTACVPMSELNPAALALMNTYYPQPNITPNSLYDNYQANFPGSSHSSQVSGRYNRSFGNAPVRGQGRPNRIQQRNAPPTLRQSIAENFAYSHSATANSSFSPLLSGSSLTNGYSFTSSYTVGYGRINSTASLGWNRSRSITTNYFTNGPVNPAIDGINGNAAPASMSAIRRSTTTPSTSVSHRSVRAA